MKMLGSTKIKEKMVKFDHIENKTHFDNEY